MPREFARSQRLGSQIQRTLSELLQFETKDPALAGVSLTAVELSRDLGVAKVYFSLLDPDGDVAAAQAGLQRAAGFLRGKLGSAIKIRHVPELRFLHDDSIAHGFEISRLIEEGSKDVSDPNSGG
ncbi:MAG: 30S ribosome-binding factor RbfA [Gammaproteobacteria bacterium]|nr:30S ribosome-binding factor RbfA [Gammaproteobacteria bacterium]MDH4255976.1 30S ribosome-binding factor RbfA [Gammaproteobacteria bacterium]MDH5311302.1 30S ribosome-binding factor RbfA [Gammaproteobacteria bacterium]